MTNASESIFSIHFTSSRGLPGWLKAVIGRQIFYGSGEIAFRECDFVVRGLRLTWLGMPHQDEACFAYASLTGCWRAADELQISISGRWSIPRTLRFRAETTEDATAIRARLPPNIASQAFIRSEFQHQLRERYPQVWATIALLLLNITVYIALVTATGIFGGFDIPTLLLWGGNYGPTTTNGEWWRLISYQFLHANLLHIALNMWVLWSVGSLVERLYGRLSFLTLYLVAGMSGGLLSIVWDPARVTVGASGALFGLLGAMLGYLFHVRNALPKSFFRAHWLPTLLFILFNIVSSFFQPLIDNSVHVGGLITGCLLGWSLAPPLADPGWKLTRTTISGVLAFCAIFLAGVWLATAGASLMPDEKFLADNHWYGSGEVPSLRLWQKLASQADAGTISGADLAGQFEQDVRPFWKNARDRFAAEMPKLPPEQKDFGAKILAMVKLRLALIDIITKAARDSNADAAAKSESLKQELDVAGADLQRLEVRSNFEHQARSLSQSAPIVWLKNILWTSHVSCVEYPRAWATPVASSDAANDGPQMAHALGCRAQRLFLTQDFKTLDQMLDSYSRNLGDLPDGRASYEAMTNGLDHLFTFSDIPSEQLWGLTSAWRRQTGNSPHAEVAEALVLMDWGFRARGAGTVDTISQQAMQQFRYRTQMSAAALKGMQGWHPPLWYQLFIDTELYLTGDKKRMREIHARGHAKFPLAQGIDRAMLRPLMPRWGGSYTEADHFIDEQAAHEVRSELGQQRYALLFFTYSGMEDDQINIFKDVGAQWEYTSTGMEELIARHPQSDYLRNIYAKLACIKGDRQKFLALTAAFPKGFSASAWPANVTLETCDRTFKL